MTRNKEAVMKAKTFVVGLCSVVIVVFVLVLFVGMVSVVQAEQKVLSLNKATVKELQSIEDIRLPTVICKAIVDYRMKHGPFKDRMELIKVPGMTSAWFEKLNPTNKSGDVVYDPDAEPVFDRSKC
jgi:competence ComEA-like helix-hairpin-helix protein